MKGSVSEVEVGTNIKYFRARSTVCHNFAKSSALATPLGFQYLYAKQSRLAVEVDNI